MAIPAEVLGFAAEQGVEAELPAVLEMTCRAFPATHFSVALDEDPEYANDRHIVVLVKGVKLGVDQAVEARWQWHRGLLRCCPATLASIFRLGLELAA